MEPFLAWFMQFTLSEETSRHPWPCISDPGAEVAGVVYLNLSVKTDQLSISCTFTSFPELVKTLSLFERQGNSLESEL